MHTLCIRLIVWLNLLQRGVQLFLQWAMMQGVAMLLQNRYQRQRLYTRIALGKVPFETTSISHWSLYQYVLLYVASHYITGAHYPYPEIAKFKHLTRHAMMNIYEFFLRFIIDGCCSIILLICWFPYVFFLLLG